MPDSRKKKRRLDQLLISRGLAGDIDRAKALILSGEVMVDGCVIKDPLFQIEEDSDINVVRRGYVSRGGEKLEGALADFNLDVRGFVCADIGISTGGFTDCLLKHGASRIYGFDVGYGVVDYSLRNDSRIILFERCNFRKFDTSLINEKMDLVVIDVSFISLKKIIPNALNLLKNRGYLLSLLKPQFEAPRGLVRGGILRDEKILRAVIEDFESFIKGLGISFIGLKPSRIRGKKGNQEYFILSRL